MNCLDYSAAPECHAHWRSSSINIGKAVRKPCRLSHSICSHTSRGTGLARGELLANMAHETRTPLSAIIDMARLTFKTGVFHLYVFYACPRPEGLSWPAQFVGSIAGMMF
jgi:hypothetical protein